MLSWRRSPPRHTVSLCCNWQRPPGVQSPYVVLTKVSSRHTVSLCCPDKGLLVYCLLMLSWRRSPGVLSPYVVLTRSPGVLSPCVVLTKGLLAYGLLMLSWQGLLLVYWAAYVVVTRSPPGILSPYVVLTKVSWYTISFCCPDEGLLV